MRLLSTIPLVALSIFLFSCESNQPVEWSSLSELDDLSIKVEQAAAAHEHDMQKQLLTEAKVLISQVHSSVPDNAKNKDEVAVLVGDLEALTTQLSNLDALGHDELDTLSKAIHPIVASIMETAGVPHVHGEVACSDSECELHDHNHDHKEKTTNP